MKISQQGRQTIRWRPPAAILKMRSIALLIAGDVLSISGAFLATWLLRSDFAASRTLLFVSVLVPVYLVVAASTNAYDSRCLRDPPVAIKKSWYALVVALALLVTVGFYLRSTQDFSRVMTGVGSTGAIILVAAVRWLLVTRLPILAGGDPFSSALIYDDPAPWPDGDFSVVLDAGIHLDPEQHDPLMYDRLATALAAMDRVVVTCRPERRQAWARAQRAADRIRRLPFNLPMSSKAD